MENSQINQVTIGALLKAKREELELPQREIARILGYKNINFISMLETGRTNIPLARFNDILKAYGIKNDRIAVFVKLLNPECWNLCMSIFKDFINPEQLTDEKTIEDKVEKILVEDLKKYNLKSFADLRY